MWLLTQQPIPPLLPFSPSTGALGWRNHNQARQGRRRGAARVPRFTVLGSYQSLQLKAEHYDVRRGGREDCTTTGAASAVPLICSCSCPA